MRGCVDHPPRSDVPIAKVPSCGQYYSCKSMLTSVQRSQITFREVMSCPSKTSIYIKSKVFKPNLGL